MRVLITGGTGFIGSRLALRCIELGHHVRVYALVNTEGEGRNRHAIETAGVELITGSMADKEAVRAAASEADVVFHLAAAQHEMNVPDGHFRDVNVEGTRNLLEACAAAGAKRFVYGSTIGVYGELAGEIDEGSPVNPDNIYGMTKLEAERLALSYKDRLSVVAVRIPETYGPGDGRLLKLFKSIKRGVFFMIGNGRNRHHLIYVEDLIDGLLRAAEADNAVGEMFVLSGKDAPSTNEMVETIAGALSCKMPKVRAPLGLFMLAATVLEGALRPLGIQPPLHRRRMDFFRKSFTFSGRKAAEELDFRPATSFREGAALTAKWYAETGQL